MAALDDLKTITNVSESILNIYIRRACVLIKNYLNVADTVDVASTYPDAVIEYVTERLSKKGNEGLKQFVQGGRQGTYVDGLTEDVKVLLPSPFVKMIG